MKIVINRCYGGFSLSHKAIMHYAKIKGLKLYIITEVRNENGCIDFKDYTFEYCEYDEDSILGESYITKPLSKDGQYEEDSWFSPRNIERNDPVLVQVVEKLEAEANGRFANLDVVEIPDNVDWEIEEYDGQEWVSEKHRTW